MLERRTIRHYSSQQIKDPELQLILKAGLYAPSGGGRQSPIMLVCQDLQINEQLGCINRYLFGGANSDGIHFVSETQKSIADDDSIISAFYGAPTVVTLFAPERWLYGINDCTSAATNMSLAAWSLGIGSCYVSRSEETFKTNLGRELMEKVGIDDYYVARVHLCLGYPLMTFPKPKPRKEGRIKFL